MTRNELLTRWTDLRNDRLNDEYADLVTAISSLDDLISNECENLVAEAIKQGLIIEDREDNGWQEGWSRMLVQLDSISTETSE